MPSLESSTKKATPAAKEPAVDEHGREIVAPQGGPELTATVETPSAETTEPAAPQEQTPEPKGKPKTQRKSRAKKEAVAVVA